MKRSLVLGTFLLAWVVPAAGAPVADRAKPGARDRPDVFVRAVTVPPP